MSPRPGSSCPGGHRTESQYQEIRWAAGVRSGGPGWGGESDFIMCKPAGVTWGCPRICRDARGHLMELDAQLLLA